MSIDDVNEDSEIEESEPEAVASYATEGEAEVAQAKLRAFGVDSALDDQVEGGSVPVEGEPGVIVEVRAEDAADAIEILTPDAADAADVTGEDL